MKKILLTLLAVLMSFGIMMPISADEKSTVTISGLDKETYTVGESVEFSVSGNPVGNDKGQKVKGYISGVNRDLVKVEYYETASGMEGWKELTTDYFGPESGFPFVSEATSKFRVSFLKAGELNFTVSIKTVAGGTVLVETAKTLKIEESSPAVAKIGDVEYKSLQEALNAAQSKDIVELLTDVTLEATDAYAGVYVNDGVTLDGGNHTISFDEKASAIVMNGTSTVQNVKFNLIGDAKYAVQALNATATVKNVTINDETEKYAGILVNGGTVTLQGNVSYTGNSYAAVELGKGVSATSEPKVVIDGKFTVSENVSPIYVAKDQISDAKVEELVELTENADGALKKDDELVFDENGNIVVKPEEKPEPEEKPSTPSISCAGDKDKNCDGVVTCEEEKGKGWIWNNTKKVCEYNPNAYTVVNTGVK